VTQPRRPDPEPLKTNDMLTVLVGIGLWAVALVVLLIVRPAETWTIWTCAAGIGLGFLGLLYIHRRDAKQAP
jgi:hypothetical protein